MCGLLAPMVRKGSNFDLLIMIMRHYDYAAFRPCFASTFIVRPVYLLRLNRGFAVSDQR
jgi:hypothetical protein